MQVSEATKTFLTGYFATCRRSTKTRAAYEIDLAQLTAYLGPDKPLEAVEPEDMENWAQDMKNRGFASLLSEENSRPPGSFSPTGSAGSV